MYIDVYWLVRYGIIIIFNVLWYIEYIYVCKFILNCWKIYNVWLNNRK